MSAVHYTREGEIATIRIDDGKRNALSPGVLREIYAAFDRAEADNALVIFTGREDVYSAGFDLKVMKRGGVEAIRMLALGYGLTARIMRYPRPVICACNGHSLAMGIFMMLSGDYVIGSRGDFRIAANEVALGLTMPRVAAAMLKHRLDPCAYQHAVVLSTSFTPDEALAAGFFDELVEPAALIARAEALAEEFAALDARAHRATKRRIRRALVRKIRWSLPLDLADAVLMGLRGAKPR